MTKKNLKYKKAIKAIESMNIDWIHKLYEIIFIDKEQMGRKTFRELIENNINTVLAEQRIDTHIVLTNSPHKGIHLLCPNGCGRVILPDDNYCKICGNPIVRIDFIHKTE